MAKTSKVVKNNKRLETVGFYYERRKELIKVIFGTQPDFFRSRHYYTSSDWPVIFYTPSDWSSPRSFYISRSPKNGKHDANASS